MKLYKKQILYLKKHLHRIYLFSANQFVITHIVQMNIFLLKLYYIF